MPATFFLCGHSLREPHCFWWERLERGIAQGQDLQHLIGARLAKMPASAQPATYELRVIEVLRALPPRDRMCLDHRLAKLTGPDPVDAGLRAAAIVDMACKGFEIGFHTREHYSLPQLDSFQLRQALREGRRELEALVNGRIEAIAYPYGHVDERVAAAAREAEFRIGFTATDVAIHLNDDELQLGRVEAQNISPGRFALRLARALFR